MTRHALPLVFLLVTSPALAGGGPPVTLYDNSNQQVGTSANPLFTQAAPGMGSTTTNQGASGTSPWLVTQPDVRATGTIAGGSVGANYAVATSDQGTARFVVTGLSGSGATLQAQYSADGGTTWEPIAILRPPLAYGTTITADGQYEVKASATTNLRLIVTAAGSGSISVASDLTNAQGLVGIVGSLPPGTNAIGAVTQGPAGTAAWKVDGSSVTQPVSAASLPLPTGASTAANQTSVQSAPGTSAGTAQAVQGVTGGVPQNVAASSLPLPANAAQETGGNLATLVARTPALVGGASPVTDANNVAYSAASATYATGATVTAGRAVYLNCSASGSVTMSLSGGGSLAYPVTAGANVLPFAVTSVSADTASCTHQNVN